MPCRLPLAMVLAFLAVPLSTPAQQKPAIGMLHPYVSLYSDTFSLELPLPESKQGVHSVRLEAKIDEKGDGQGLLILDPNASNFDEWGNTIRPRNHELLPLVRLDCSLKFLKEDGGSSLFEIQGPKVTSRLSLMVETKKLSFNRFLVRGKDGQVKYVVPLLAPEPKPARESF
jgi:hypothetical protein